MNESTRSFDLPWGVVNHHESCSCGCLLLPKSCNPRCFWRTGRVGATPVDFQQLSIAQLVDGFHRIFHALLHCYPDPSIYKQLWQDCKWLEWSAPIQVSDQMCHWLENPDGFFPPAISADGKQVITSEAFNGGRGRIGAGRCLTGWGRCHISHSPLNSQCKNLS